MKFYQTTKSFELVSLLDKIKINNRLKNSVLFIAKFEKFRFSMNKKIKLSSDKIDLLLELFKEYFYLDQIVSEYKLTRNSHFNYTIFNHNIIAHISYKDIKVSIEYNMKDNNSCIFLSDKYKGYNLTSKNIKIFKMEETLYSLLKNLLSDIDLILNQLYRQYAKKEG